LNPANPAVCEYGKVHDASEIEDPIAKALRRFNEQLRDAVLATS
jgi:hypothetical protein